MVKNHPLPPTTNAGDIRYTGLIPGSAVWKIPGEANGNPLHCSWKENPMDRGAWQATTHRAAQSLTQLKRLSTAQHSFSRKDVHITLKSSGEGVRCPAGLPKSVSSPQFKSLTGQFVIKFPEMIHWKATYIYFVYKYRVYSMLKYILFTVLTDILNNILMSVWNKQDMECEQFEIQMVFYLTTAS